MLETVAPWDHYNEDCQPLEQQKYDARSSKKGQRDTQQCPGRNQDGMFQQD